MFNLTRRRFLEDTILATAAAAVPTPAAAQENRTPSASGKVTVAIIGCGIRGSYYARELGRMAGCDVAYVCDPDSARTAQVSALLVEQKRSAPRRCRICA